MPAKMPSSRREPARHRPRLLLVDGACLVVVVPREMRRHEPGCGALDAMRAAAAGRQHRRSRGLERDDPGAAATGLQRTRHADQHARGADGAAEDVDRPDLLQQLDADLAVAVQRIGVVELIGPERARLLLQRRDTRP